MKILHLVNAKVIGGGEQYLYDLAANMKGDSVIIAADSACKEVYGLYDSKFQMLDVKLRSLLGLGALISLLRFIRLEHIDVINCHSGTICFLSVLLKKCCPWVKLVVFRHNVCPNRSDFFHRWMQKNFDAIICVSKAVYDLQNKTIAKLDKDKLHLIPNGIDVKRFSKYPEKVVGIHDVLQLGYAGRVVKNKGIEFALAAIVKLKSEVFEVVFRIAGPCEDKYRKILYKYICDNNLNGEVQFLGLQSDMEKFYKDIDILLAPSIVKEAFGLSIVESMYCGTPVIASGSGAQREIITDSEDGIILRDVSVNELASAIRKAADGSIYQKLQMNGKNKAVCFSMDLCAKKIYDVYCQLLKK